MCCNALWPCKCIPENKRQSEKLTDHTNDKHDYCSGTQRTLYARFSALVVFEQQPGVAVRKEILRRRGLFTSSRARHPGATIAPAMAAQLEVLLQRTLPGVDLGRPIAVEDAVVSRP